MKKTAEKLLLLILCCIMLTGCKKTESERIRIGSLKGPTSIGLLHLMEDNKNGTGKNKYEFTIYTSADEILPLLVKGEIDVALVPANVAAALYNKSDAQITVIDINTLNVLNLIGTNEIDDVKQLEGKTIYTTGKGTTPDLILSYILEQAGLTQKTKVEFMSEATEVVNVLKENSDAIGLLPQPFATVVCMQNEKLKAVADVNEMWKEANGFDCDIITGVTVATREYIDNHRTQIELFERYDHANSCKLAVQKNPIVIASAVENGILANETVAGEAIPKCETVCIYGDEMKELLSNYLEVIYECDAQFIGGKLPEDDFYCIIK